MDKKNIFITGASGFVGQNLIAYLNKNKADFSIHAFLHKNELKNSLFVDDISYGDIVDYDSLEKSFSKHPIDVIIHLAAAIKSPNEKDHLDVNIKGTQNIVHLAEKYKVKKVIFLSTDFVLYNIAHPYRESKLQCEKIFSNSNLDFTIFRPSPIYGPGDNKNFAALIPLIKKNFVIPAIKCKMEPVYVGNDNNCH
jgi:NADH dehydrogenase